jgi:hypothetical protein
MSRTCFSKGSSSVIVREYQEGRAADNDRDRVAAWRHKTRRSPHRWTARGSRFFITDAS